MDKYYTLGISVVGFLWSVVTYGQTVSSAVDDEASRQWIRQQEHSKAQQQQQDTRVDIRLDSTPSTSPAWLSLPDNETPCFQIEPIRLQGLETKNQTAEDEVFAWVLEAADSPNGDTHDLAISQTTQSGLHGGQS